MNEICHQYSIAWKNPVKPMPCNLGYWCPYISQSMVASILPDSCPTVYFITLEVYEASHQYIIVSENAAKLGL